MSDFAIGTWDRKPINHFELVADLVNMARAGKNTCGLATVSLDGKKMEFYFDPELGSPDVEKGKKYFMRGELRTGVTPARVRFDPTPVITEFMEIREDGKCVQVCCCGERGG